MGIRGSSRKLRDKIKRRSVGQPQQDAPARNLQSTLQPSNHVRSIDDGLAGLEVELGASM
jgi:hypothetical protein